ncbi:MAG: GDCCVxC domain-containing (seleno)protein [Candidatus Odinarchaeota archaeon]
MTSVKIETRLKCPHCGLVEVVEMPLDRCIIRHECGYCQSVIVPKKGDCCIFCSHGNIPCPSEQE